jgi:hypothetical protein
MSHPATDSVARAQLSQIFFARLNDSASAHAIAPGVCYCCKTSLAAAADGTVVAAWRHVYPGNMRDIALAKSSDGGRTFGSPVRVSEDQWAIDGCPENGPAVAIDRTRTIHVVWPTLVPASAGAEENLALFYAASQDGQRFTKRLRIPTEGVPRHPQIDLAADGIITVAWDEQLKGARRVVVARGIPDDMLGVRFKRQAIDHEPGTYPVVVSLADAVVMVSTAGTPENSVLHVERMPLWK